MATYPNIEFKFTGDALVPGTPALWDTGAEDKGVQQYVRIVNTSDRAVTVLFGATAAGDLATYGASAYCPAATTLHINLFRGSNDSAGGAFWKIAILQATGATGSVFVWGR